MNTFAQIFEQLNNTRRTRADGTQCWLYSDLNNLYNIHPGKLRTTQSQVFSALFENRAAYNAAARQYPNDERPMIPFYHDHITTVYHDYDITTGPYPQHIKNGHDLEMSRYACWALLAAQPGISTTFGETYFLYPDAGPERLAALTREFMRLPLRQNLCRVEKIMGGILHRHGIKFSVFNQTVHRAFFDGIDATTLKEYYAIPIKPSDPLANYLGAVALMGKYNALRGTIDEYDRRNGPGSDTLLQIAAYQLRQQRIHMIQNYHRAPERNIHITPIAKVKTHQNQAIRLLTKNYGHITR